MKTMFDGLTYPWFYWLSLFALFVAMRFWPRQKWAAVSLPTASLCRDLMVPRTRRWLWMLTAFWGAAATCLLIALAGPRTSQPISLASEGITLALVVDISGSMATPDFSLDGKRVSRLVGVQKVFRLLVAGGVTSEGLVFPGRPNDRIALVTFAARPDTACPPTLDHAALLTILDRQTPKTLVTEATTNPGDAIAWALETLHKAPTRRKALVFLTDGESNVPPPALSPGQAGKLAAALKIPIYAIDALDDAEAGADAPKAHQTLADLAATTGGRHFRATDGAALLQAFHELDKLERDAIARPDEIVYGDLTMPYALVAFTSWLAYLVGWIALGRWTP